MEVVEGPLGAQEACALQTDSRKLGTPRVTGWEVLHGQSDGHDDRRAAPGPQSVPLELGVSPGQRTPGSAAVDATSKQPKVSPNIEAHGVQPEHC